MITEYKYYMKIQQAKRQFQKRNIKLTDCFMFSRPHIVLFTYSICAMECNNSPFAMKILLYSC